MRRSRVVAQWLIFQEASHHRYYPAWQPTPEISLATRPARGEQEARGGAGSIHAAPPGKFASREEGIADSVLVHEKEGARPGDLADGGLDEDIGGRPMLKFSPGRPGMRAVGKQSGPIKPG